MIARPSYGAFTRTTATKPRAKRTNPEGALQVQVKKLLVLALPPEIEWTSSLTGQNLTKRAAELASARGIRRGFPDMLFIINRRCFWIELKAPFAGVRRDPGRYGTLDDPDLSDDQRRVLAALNPSCWAICRSLEEVKAALERFGAPLQKVTFT